MEETKRKQQEIRDFIKSDSVNKKLNVAHQNRHICDSGGYIEGRSYLYSGVEPETLIEQYHGTGDIRFSAAGNWINKEFIKLDRDIGIHIEQRTGIHSTTNSFGIHYSKSGAHVVPSRRQD